MVEKRTTIDDYLARLPEAPRAVLEQLRGVVNRAAPGVEECISYQMPAFRFEGRMLVAFGAASKHLALYPMSGTIVGSMQDELADYDTSKGTIRFKVARPLPAALVRKIVQARIAEIRAG